MFDPMKPVHINNYWRYRLLQWEFVHEHWRSLLADGNPWYLEPWIELSDKIKSIS